MFFDDDDTLTHISCLKFVRFLCCVRNIYADGAAVHIDCIEWKRNITLNDDDCYVNLDVLVIVYKSGFFMTSKLKYGLNLYVDMELKV